MKVPVPRLAFIATLACACFCAPASAQLFKCKLADGRTVYQDSKCAEEARQSVVAPPAGAAGAPVGGPCPTHLIEKPEVDPKTGMESDGARKSRIALEMVVEIVSGYDLCAAEVPGFPQRFGSAYGEWRTRFANEISAYQSNRVARRMVECRREHEAQRSRQHGADLPGKTGYCMQMVGPGLERMNREGMPQ